MCRLELLGIILSSVNSNLSGCCKLTPDVLDDNRNLKFELLNSRAQVVVLEVVACGSILVIGEVKLARNLEQSLHSVIVEVTLHIVVVAQSITVSQARNLDTLDSIVIEVVLRITSLLVNALPLITPILIVEQTVQIDNLLTARASILDDRVLAINVDRTEEANIELTVLNLNRLTYIVVLYGESDDYVQVVVQNLIVLVVELLVRSIVQQVMSSI